jgi:multidrug efflux pump subunit AcrB
MRPVKYVLLIVGTVIGLIFAYNNTGTEFYVILPVPLGLIGFAIGALYTPEHVKSDKE